MGKNDNFAVIRTGGNQYLVAKDDIILIDRIKTKGKKKIKKGEKIEFETLIKAKNNTTSIGNPNLQSGLVKAEVIDGIKGEKLIIFKYKPKKKYRKKTGYRAKKLKIKILNI